jgi:general stress protein 26
MFFPYPQTRRRFGYANGMTVRTEETPRTLEDAISGLRFAMVAVESSAGISARPLTLLEHDDTTLRFLVSKSAEWVRGRDSDFAVNAAFADPGKDKFAAVEGRGRIVTDRAVIDRLWNPAAGVYFDGKDDPDIAVLEVDVTGGEYWDGPSSKVGQALSMVLTKVRGETQDDHGDIITNR